MSTDTTTYRFGVYEVRPRTRELYKEGRKLKLRPQAYQVLLALVEHAGDVVTREQLRDRVWSSDTFVDFEHGLNTAIKELRATLNDSATEPRYIETLPKLGYRMVAAVEKEVKEVAAIKDQKEGRGRRVAGAEAPAARTEAEGAARKFNWAWVVTGVLALIAIVIGGARMQKRGMQPGGAPGSSVVAVLPFENLTGDAEQEYFSDGLTEEMIARLGRIDPEHLEVIARTSVMHYKHTQEAMEQISRELGVQYVLEGSVRRDAEKVRVNAELIRTKDQKKLWSNQYDRELSSLLKLQGEIAQTTAEEIAETLNSAKPRNARDQASAHGEEYEAYDLYLRGLYFWNKRTTEGFEKAIGYFQEAIAKDPGYAPAYAGLANSYSLLTGYSISPGTRYMEKARAAAKRALELDGNLPEAHTAKALVLQNYDWNWQEAEKEFRRAIELNPNYATAHHWYAEHLGFRGRFDEAFAESEKARRLDPLSLIIASDYGALLYYARRYEEAEAEFRKVLEMDANFPRGQMIMDVHVAQGRLQEAEKELEARRKISGEGVWYWRELSWLNLTIGDREKTRRALARLEELRRNEAVDPMVMVIPEWEAGEKEKAFEWLEKAYKEHSNLMTTLKVDPEYDTMRGEARFGEMVKRVGLADETEVRK